MLRILLINDTPKKVGRLKSALVEAGFEVIDESGLTIDLPERVEAVRPDVVLIDTESPGRDVMEQVVLVTRDQPRPIVMFTDEHDPQVMVAADELLEIGPGPGERGGDIVARGTPAEIVAKINDPAFLVGVIPAKTYEGQNSDVTTVSVFNYLVTHEGVSTDTVYTMTKSMFENLDQMSAAHSAAKAIKKENAAKTPPAPLHPGAEKYYREIGLIK